MLAVGHRASVSSGAWPVPCNRVRVARLSPRTRTHPLRASSDQVLDPPVPSCVFRNILLPLQYFTIMVRLACRQARECWPVSAGWRPQSSSSQSSRSSEISPQQSTPVLGYCISLLKHGCPNLGHTWAEPSGYRTGMTHQVGFQ